MLKCQPSMCRKRPPSRAGGDWLPTHPNVPQTCSSWQRMRESIPELATPIHQHPDECVPLLGFRPCDGGRGDYFHKIKRTDIPPDIQDCAVVAVSTALFFNPRVCSPSLSYRDSFHHLEDWNHRIEPWKRKGFRETRKEYLFRRLREFLSEKGIIKNSIHQDPRYGVNTNVLSDCLLSFGFSFVFGEPLKARPFCLCSPTGTFVIEGIVQDGDAHAFAVIDRTILADDDFRIHFDGFHVMHVWYRS